MSDTDIFLSYSREDRAAAKHFAESFAREGFTVWWDAALRSGQTFDEVIERELRAAKAVVVLWSPRSVASRWVRAEATLADRRNKLVPAIIEACDRPIIFELTHAADLADWTGDTSDSRWQTLVSDLRRLVGGGEEVPAAPPNAAEPQPEPKAVHAAPPAPPAERRAPAHEPARAKSLSPANVDELLFAASRLREARAAPRRPQPTHLENLDETEFYKRSDEFAEREERAVHCLELIGGARRESRFVVGGGAMTIGRTPPADIILAGAGISRAHCQIALDGDELLVSDLNSTNGTYIDDQRIGRTAVLPVGSVLRVGNVAFTHVVRTGAELQPQGNPIGLNPGPNFRPARVAGTT